MAKLKQMAVTINSTNTIQALSATDILAQSLIIIADSGNAGVVYVGDEDMDDSDGIPLDPAGTDSVTLKPPESEQTNRPSDYSVNLKDVYIYGAAGDIVRVSYFQII